MRQLYKKKRLIKQVDKIQLNQERKFKKTSAVCIKLILTFATTLHLAALKILIELVSAKIDFTPFHKARGMPIPPMKLSELGKNLID